MTKTLWRNLRAGIALILSLWLMAVSAHAQMPGTSVGQTTEDSAIVLPDPLTPEAVREMVARLSDAEVRGLLLDRLDAVAQEASAPAAQQATFADFFEAAAFSVYNGLAESIRRLPVLVDRQVDAFVTFSDRLGPGGLFQLLGLMAITLGAGFAAEWAFNHFTRRWHDKNAEQTQASSLQGTLKFLFNRFCRDVLGIIVFIIVGRIVGRNLIPAESLPIVSAILLNLVAMPRLGAAVSRFVLAPRKPQFRLLSTDDATAKFLHRNIIGIMLLMGFTMAIVRFNALNGVGVGETRLGYWLNLGVHVWIGLMAWRAWDGLQMMMRGADPSDVTPTEDRVARAYPAFAIGVSVAIWVLVNVLAGFGAFERLAGGAHYWTMLILLLAPAMDTMIRGLVRHLVPPMRGEGALAEKAYNATKRSYIRIGRVLVFGLVLMILARIWGVDFSSAAAASGMVFVAKMFQFVMILAIGYLVWEVVSLWINRILASEHTPAEIDANQEEPAGGEGGGAGGSRLSTVLPLVLAFLKAAIAVIFVLIALGDLGVDITPLLAGAGIVGLAVGFGAQKLVSDVVSGIFFLVDDAFRTGEYVEVGGTVGTVERISIRSMQLRHHKGPVHTIPYGEIPQITNYSRDWVIVKMKFTVPFETDPNQVKKIFKQIGKDMMAVPEFAQDMLQPFKSQGVFDFDDVGMILRGKFMAKPGRQFVLRKEIYNRVKSAFDSNGIDFARREVRIALPGTDPDVPLTDEEKQMAGAAAAAQIAQKESP